MLEKYLMKLNGRIESQIQKCKKELALNLLRSRRLRWLGHVAPMDNSRIPKQILYGELYESTCNIGRPKLCFKHHCKTSMIEFSINVANWDVVAQDRVGWRATVLIGAKSYEKNRVSAP